MSSSTDQTLIERRVGSWGFAPWLLLAGHIIIATCLLLQDRPPASWEILAMVFVPLGLSLVVDIAAGLVLIHRSKFGLAPHNVARLMCGYIGATGVLWMLASAATGGLHFRDAGFVTLAMATGFFVRSMAAVAAPPLAIVNLLVAFLATLLFSSNPLISFAINLLALTIFVYSTAVTQKAIAGGRRRLALEWQAKKALNFVDEFENSGRGWFWETDSLGTLSYVSAQLAEDFQCEPAALLGRQFTDLLSVDSTSETVEERKTLGFHLSARFPFSDVVVRPASDQDVHWSLSGNPIFDDNGRFFGFRGIGTDLTEQRRSEREISRLARFDSLTSLPNRAMMRQTLEEALRNAAHRQKGCAMFIIDLDRFKNVNDTLGHPIGDALLRQVAERLKSVMGNHGQVGRLGGDEFQAVLPGTVDIGLIEALSRTLIEQVSRPYVIEGHKVTIGASVGIAIGDPGRSSADALVRNADLALYAAKAAGRGKHCLYEPSMHSERLGTSVARERPSPGDRARRAKRRLPADRPRRRRGDFGIRGAGPLDAPVARPDPARQVRSAGRGSGPDRQDRRMGPEDLARGGRELARPGARRGQRVATPVQRPSWSRWSRTCSARPEFAPTASKSRSPRACSSPTAIRPTRPSPSSRKSASASRSTISAPAIVRSAI